MPLISFITVTRNDGFEPDLLYRLSTMLNYAAMELERVGRLADVEFIVVDWASEKPLVEAVELSAPAAAMTRFISLSADAIKSVGGHVDRLNIALAVNAGIRRARGQCIMVGPADILMPECAWVGLFNLVAGEGGGSRGLGDVLYLLMRHEIPAPVISAKRLLEDLKAYVLKNTLFMDVDRVTVSAGGGAGVLVAAVSVWQKLCGLQECCDLGIWADMEVHARASLIGSVMSMDGMGIRCYHMGHSGRGGRAKKAIEGFHAVRQYPRRAEANNPDWGLKGCELEEMRAIPVVTGTHAVTSSSLDVPSWLDEMTRVPLPDALREALAAHHALMGYSCCDPDGACMPSPSLQTVLAWTCSRLHPLRVLVLNTRHGHDASLIGQLCPWAELYLLGPWVGPVIKKFSPQSLASELQSAGHKAYCRFWGGDRLVDDLDVVARTEPGLRYELILLHHTGGLAELGQVLDKTLPLLEHGGAILMESAVGDVAREAALRMASLLDRVWVDADHGLVWGWRGGKVVSQSSGQPVGVYLEVTSLAGPYGPRASSALRLLKAVLSPKKYFSMLSRVVGAVRREFGV